MIPFILGMVLCDVEHTFSTAITAVLTSEKWQAVSCLWTLRLLIAYGWFAASVW